MAVEMEDSAFTINKKLCYPHEFKTLARKEKAQLVTTSYGSSWTSPLQKEHTIPLLENPGNDQKSNGINSRDYSMNIDIIL